MEFLLALNILWSCTSTFNCRQFIPTISYLACYKGHDRLFNVTMMYWFFYLLIFTLISFLHFRSSSKVYNTLFLLVSICISVLQPCIAIIDEASTSHVLPIDKIHRFMISLVIIFLLLWIYLTSFETKIQLYLKKYIGIGIICLFWSIAQWFYAERDGCIFNYIFEAISEWITISIGIFLPYMYSRFYTEIFFITKFRR